MADGADLRVAAASNEQQADFERTALPWMADVFRFARSLARDPHEAEDLVQETYLRAFRSWHTFQPGSDARRWLFTICRNVFLRSRERSRHETVLDDPEVETLETLAAQRGLSEDVTARLLARVDLAPALSKALHELPEPFKSAVVLVDLEDQSYDEASEVLGVPIGTVRSRLFRGRRQLQEKLLEFARDAGFATAAPARRA